MKVIFIVKWCLIVVTVWGHRAEADRVPGIFAVVGLIDREIGGSFRGLDIAEPLYRVVVKAFAAFMPHILGQAVNHQPEGNVNGTLHEHRVSIVAGSLKSACDVVATAEVGGDLFESGNFGRLSGFGISGYLLIFV